jgi:hypothetical protein
VIPVFGWINTGDVPGGAIRPALAAPRRHWGPLASYFPRSGNAHRLGRERPCQQIMDRPPTTRHAGRHRQLSLALALPLALSTTVDRAGQRLLERHMWPHEVIVCPPPLQME